MGKMVREIADHWGIVEDTLGLADRHPSSPHISALPTIPTPNNPSPPDIEVRLQEQDRKIDRILSLVESLGNRPTPHPSESQNKHTNIATHKPKKGKGKGKGKGRGQRDRDHPSEPAPVNRDSYAAVTAGSSPVSRYKAIYSTPSTVVSLIPHPTPGQASVEAPSPPPDDFIPLTNTLEDH